MPHPADAYAAMPSLSRGWLVLLWAALALAMGVGVLGRSYWTPDEPREADIAWRMSWQADKAVPLLAGDAFCEKPPLTYWLSGAAIGVLGSDAWMARLPNLLYALITALAVGSLARRGAGPLAGLVAAAAISTFLLSYQVAIWLATDAPLLAAVAVALRGLYIGFYATGSRARLRGYTGMHAALALGFLSKSAVAWMVPALALITLVIWEKRWRELLCWELYVGLILQAVLILAWIGFVVAGPDGMAHLKVFFWNNLVGRFARVDAAEEFQYAAAHRNSPGKYLLELPAYLWPWTLLMLVAMRTAWRHRSTSFAATRLERFAIATFLPTLAVLSVAATARNIYLAPALPGLALLLGCWAQAAATQPDPWDARAIRGTMLLLTAAMAVFAMALAVTGWDSWPTLTHRAAFVTLSVLGLSLGAAALLSGRHSLRSGRIPATLFALLLAYCTLLIGPASQLYGRIDTWQDLASIGRAVARDSEGRPLILMNPDETTRAFVDMYGRTAVVAIPGPVATGSLDRLNAVLSRAPRSLVLVQLAGRGESGRLREAVDRSGLTRFFPPQAGDTLPSWAAALAPRRVTRYGLPNGRRYALLEPGSPITSR